MPLLSTSVRSVVLLHLLRWCVVSWHRSVLIAFRPKRYEKKIWGVVFWRNHINGICFCWYHPLSCVTFLNYDTFLEADWSVSDGEVAILRFQSCDSWSLWMEIKEQTLVVFFLFFVVDDKPRWLCYGILSSTNIRWQICFFWSNMFSNITLVWRNL